MTAESTSANSESAADTEAAGERLAAVLEPGDLVLVSGDLGTGKTTFIRGACRALGVSDPVSSPTFVVGQVYGARGDLEIAHLDLYRLEGLDPEEPGLLGDYLTPRRIGFIEWPDVAAGDLPEARAQVRLSHAGEDQRVIDIALGQ